MILSPGVIDENRGGGGPLCACELIIKALVDSRAGKELARREFSAREAKERAARVSRDQEAVLART